MARMVDSVAPVRSGCKLRCAGFIRLTQSQFIPHFASANHHESVV